MSGLREIGADEIAAQLNRPQVVGECVDFRHCHVSEPLSLAGRTLCGFDFSNCRFDAAVDFSGARFEGLSWFIGSQFHDRCNFSQACFSIDARFDHCRFDSSADFAAVEFRGIGAFDHAVFQQILNFSSVVAYGNLSLQESRISGDFRLTDATLMGGLWSPGADLLTSPQAAGLQVHGRQFPSRF